MGLSSGQVTFAVFFLVVFVIGMVWAYAKDRKKQRTYFKGSVFVLADVIVMFMIFKMISSNLH